MKTFTIYAIKNKYNERVYVGSTSNFTRRKNGHLRMLKNNQHKNRRLQKDFNKFGNGAFEISILCETRNEDTRLKFEQIFIDGFDRPYNILPKAGSALGRKYTQITLDKMSATAKGRVISEQQREKMRAARVYVPITEETRRKMSKTHKERYESGQSNYYSKLNEDQVYEILQLLDKGENRKGIAEKFNVSYSNVGHIAQGLTWKKVLEKYKNEAEAV